MTSSPKKFSLESVLTKVYALIISLQNPTDCTYLLSILYNIAFFMQFTTIPFLIKNIGISDIQYGYIQTIFGFYQMCGGPIYGFIIKKFGIRNALYLCYGSTMLSGVLLFNSTDFTSLIISRTPCLFMHGQQGHQSMLSFLTNPGKERTNAFGRMGLTFGLGFMFTPIFTIISSQISYRTPMLISAVLCILPVVLLHSVSINSYKKVVEDSPVDSKVTVNLYSIIDILKRPGIANILLKKNAPIVPMLLCFAIMQVHIINEFNASSESCQLIQMLTGLCIMFSNGFGVIWLRKNFNENSLLFFGMACFLISFILFFYFTSLWMILLIMPFVALGMSLVATVADSLLTTLVEENEQGIVLGIASTINSFVRTFSPVIAGLLLENYGFTFFATFGTVGSILGHISIFFLPLTGITKYKKANE